MSNRDRIVFPDQVEDAKAEAADAKKNVGGETNTIDEPIEPKESSVTVETRNFIQAPPNCPDGYEMGADGKCREVF